jgi:hypothetical protein
MEAESEWFLPPLYMFDNVKGYLLHPNWASMRVQKAINEITRSI